MTGMQSKSETSAQQLRIAPLSVILGVVFVFFCSILAFVFVAAKRANPVMLDQQGRPLHSSSQPDGGQH